jgi:pimeloyl-ACP methyl ester carboxylesterase
VAEVVARGVRFNTHVLGAGEPVVAFIHGLVFDNLSSFYFTLAPRLSPQATLVLYDLRGHGRSEQPPDGYAVADMVDDLRGVLERVGHGERPVTLVGNSFGGLIALRHALAHPDRTASIVLIDAQVGDAAFGPRMGETLGLEGEERDHKLEEMFGDWFARHSRGGTADRDAVDYRAVFERTRARRRKPLERVADRLVHETSLVADLEATPQLTDAELARVACPVLAIYGEHSELRPEGEYVAARLPRCELEVLAGCGHLVLMHETEHVAERIGR